MNRRDFLARFVQTAVGAAALSAGALDLERLVWTPGAKTIVLPPEPRLAFRADAFSALDWDHFKTMPIEARFDVGDWDTLVRAAAHHLADQIDRDLMQALRVGIDKGGFLNAETLTMRKLRDALALQPIRTPTDAQLADAVAITRRIRANTA